MINSDSITLQAKAEGFIGIVVRCLPATKKCLETYSKVEVDHTNCAQVASYYKTGWERNQITTDIHPYWEAMTVYAQQALAIRQSDCGPNSTEDRDNAEAAQ